MKKKIYRKIIIILMAIIAIALAIMNFKVEPADYSKSLNKEISKANKIMKEAKIGNDEGEYSNYAMLEFINDIKVAKDIAEDKDSYYDIEKSAYNNLKSAIKKFKKSKNSNCLSKNKIKDIKNNLTKVTETEVINEKYNVIWHIDGKNIKEPNAINLEAKIKTPYTNRINEYINKLNLNARKISFCHNEELPGKATVYINYKYDKTKDKISLYKFNTDNNTLEYKGDAIINDSNIQIEIDEGGDYLLLENKLENYATEEEIKEAEKEINENQDKLDLKDKEEKIKENDTTIANSQSSNNTNNTNDTNDITNEEVKKDSVDKPSTEENKDLNTEQSKDPSDESNTQTKDPIDNNKVTCTIEIRCDTLAGTGNLQKLEKEEWVPSDGTILKPTKVTIDKGKSVYDVLLSVCRNNSIPIDAEYTQMYSGYYVKGINFLYEFDGGDLSGWMYRVNGDFPNYGCSNYIVKEGDMISWLYTCDMGTDIGEDHSDWE